MKLITRDTDYALRAVCFIAKGKGKVVAATELVAALDIPRPFLRKILQVLSREGLLKSHKGQGGGFILGKEPEKISLLALMKIFQGPFKLNECMFRKEICPNIKKCLLRKKIKSIEEHVFSELKPVTVSSLLRH